MFTTSQFCALSLNTPTFVVTPPDADFYPAQESLADELAAPLPAGICLPPAPSVDPDDFEKLYRWFLA